MKRRKADDPRQASAPGWFVSFSDLVTLLLGFFVAMVSFSSFENRKFQQALGSIRIALQTPFTNAQPLSSSSLLKLQDQLMVEEEAAETAAAVKELAEEKGLAAQIGAEATPEGVRISLSNPILFDEGKDELHSASQGFLIGLAKIIMARNPAGILIEGHTDDTPIHSERFPSNWELSAARALRVLKLFQSAGVNARDMVAIGYAEYRPKVVLPKSATSEAKAVNRRVEIVLQLHSGQGGLFAPHVETGAKDDHQ